MLTFSGIDSEPPISIWPGASLAHLGQNPYGQNLWRVVWAETRHFMFDGESDGRFQWLKLYTGKKCYILERWVTAWQFSKCSPETWELTNKQLGPYPDRGVYMGPCWEFEGYPTLGAVEAIVGLIIAGDQYTDWEKNLAIIQAQERDDALALNTAKEVILDALPLSVTSGKLTDRFYKDATKIPERYSAQDIGLKVGDGKIFTR